MAMSEKKKWPLESALRVAMELRALMEPHCSRIEIAGSIRRRSEWVGDVEIVYVSEEEIRPVGFFESETTYLADVLVGLMIQDGILEARRNVKGHPTWGEKNKLATHRRTGMPVDLFRTTEPCWHNYLVCRTGPASLNQLIASRARAKGWMWHPYGSGFSRGSECLEMRSEREVLEFVGLPSMDPWERNREEVK
jgi:DNA polymerase/3'-5' exonuclease PolX